MRHTHRVDANQQEIVDALRRAGVSVMSLTKVGSGCPDLLCGYRSVNTLLEVKQPKGTLTAAQVTWHRAWTGSVFIVETPAAALRVVTGMGEVDPQ